MGVDLSLSYPGGDGPTPNDPLDADTGPNNLQNYPVLTGATQTTVAGTLNSTPNTTFTLEFFSNTECDPSGYGEGETFQADDDSGHRHDGRERQCLRLASRSSTRFRPGMSSPRRPPIPTAIRPSFRRVWPSAELPPAPTNFVAMPDCDAGRVSFYWDPLPLWPDAIEIRDADTGELVQRIDYPETQYAYCEDNNPVGRVCGDTISTTNGYRAYYMVVIHEGLTGLPSNDRHRRVW